jgi:glycosyltransferase involved in cell wall biosynthesis
MFQPLISIGIPAYKKPQYVARCLESIIQQDYKNVQVIISDDSPGEDIKQIIQPYSTQLNIEYHHNTPALRSPANWNNALDKCQGDLVLLMHQDDWFHAPDALRSYVKIFEEDKTVDFVFCQNTGVDENGRVIVLQAIPRLLKEMTQKPNQLVLAQVIGPPSNTMLRKNVKIRYDERFIWLVDVDYYVRILKAGYRYRYINRHLVSIGLHKDQTTEFVRANDHIILKENILFAAKLETTAFNDILIYDYYWRLLRNFGVQHIDDLIKAGADSKEIPQVIHHMLALQKKLPMSVLKTGVLSKLFMTISYITK